MAVIQAFKALRPAQEVVRDVAALPYDVYNRKEAADFVKDRPLSFLNIDRAESQFAPDVDTYDPRVYEKANEMIRDWTRRGIFVREEKPCYYLYAQTMDGRTQTGLVAASSIDDYLNNVILKHENTRAEKELDRINHVDRTSAQTGPIFLAYRDDERVAALLGPVTEEVPLYDFTKEDGIRHTVWKISDEALIRAITEAFAGIPHTYIADGHHRAASAVKVALKRREAHPDYNGTEEFNSFLSVLFPASALRIYDYNRVVKDLNGLTEEEFLARISEDFELTEVSGKGTPYRPEEKGSFGMFLSDKWYRLRVKEAPQSADPVKSLDVSVLQDRLLEPVLGIHDPKTDSRIDFIGGIRGLSELERRVSLDMKVAFSMFPTSMEELFRVADAGLLMPPKSTWFEPKLLSGIFIHEIER
ncbi:MAG: DUF1015 domain-containing protein [Lachnospiraceae bacterium]|nr:DUF1015 domain-containing protein [Lachnospiraceae bacterium]